MAEYKNIKLKNNNNKILYSNEIQKLYGKLCIQLFKNFTQNTLTVRFMYIFDID